jgi:nicotinamide riboside transporter PnuC
MDKLIDIILQLIIAVLGIITIYLLAEKKRAGFMIGLISEPFWLWSSWNNKQWGIVFLCFVYAYLYWKGWKKWK